MFFFALFLLFTSTNAQELGCEIDIRRLPPSPTFLQPVVLSNTFEFIYPTGADGTIVIPVDESIVIACPDGYLITDVAPESLITAICNQDNQLVVGDQVINFFNIGCHSPRLEVARYTGRICSDGQGEIVEIGFDLGNNILFLPLYELCYDKFYSHSLYAHFVVNPEIRYRESASTVYLYDDRFYNFSIAPTEIYSRSRIVETFANLTGYGADEFTGAKGNIYQYVLSRSNFIYKSQLNATAHLINNYAQWGLPSGFDWDRVLDIEVTYVRNHDIPIEVYTGTYGVVAYEHAVTGEPIPLYLVIDQYGNPAIPLPALFFKILYEPVKKEATVLLSINGNYPPTVEKYRDLCPDITASVSWLSWDHPGNPDYGYSYACSYYQAKIAIPILPDIDVVDILY